MNTLSFRTDHFRYVALQYLVNAFSRLQVREEALRCLDDLLSYLAREPEAASPRVAPAASWRWPSCTTCRPTAGMPSTTSAGCAATASCSACWSATAPCWIRRRTPASTTVPQTPPPDPLI